MRILSFDTSTDTLSLALVENGVPVFEREVCNNAPDPLAAIKPPAAAKRSSTSIGGESGSDIAGTGSHQTTSTGSQQAASTGSQQATSTGSQQATSTGSQQTTSTGSQQATSTGSQQTTSSGSQQMTSTSSQQTTSTGSQQSANPSPPRQSAAALLIPHIDEALSQCGWPKSTLDCIVVCPGPGSFTGIRTAVVTARTLAQALDLPLIPVCALETFAAASTEFPCAIVTSAGRGFFFAAAYDRVANPFPEQTTTAPPTVPFLHEVSPPAYVAAATLADHLNGVDRWLVSSEAAAALAADSPAISALPKVKNIATLQAQIATNRLSLRMSEMAGGSGTAVAPPAEPEHSPRDSAQHLQLLELFPYSSVFPLYLRSPSVTVKATTTANGNSHKADAPGRHR